LHFSSEHGIGQDRQNKASRNFKENRNERTAKEKNNRNKETESIIKRGNKKSEKFWIKSGVRQGCPMSLTLFNIYLMDLEIEMRKE